ncbi:MAG: hypothetical protein HY289_15690 [Planctomycetes bacterium]|nr:hypothetical protein [Planctomycetota bacterium]
MQRPFPTTRPPAVEIMGKIGLEPDPWQVEVLESTHSQLLLNCCRQAGKTTVVAMLGLLEAMWNPLTRVVVVSRSHRQSREVLRLMGFFFKLLGGKAEVRITADEMEFGNMSRIICLPCKEDTIRGYSHVDLLILDEAARVPDDLYRAVRPMLAVSKGRLICLSTPFGKRGFFWREWATGGTDWQRFEAPATMIPRIAADFLEKEKRALGESWFRQEYCCSFEATEGLVYPEFLRCVVREADLSETDKKAIAMAAKKGMLEDLDCGIKRVGGIDFGFRNPFAAVWGFVDREDILWLTGEHYASHKPLSYHAERLPRDELIWYADPSGANEIAELRYAGFKVNLGKNALRTGIAAVSARLQSDRLRVLEGRCPNLLMEASLYRYPDEDNSSENPVDKNNHALGALRYLISRIDAHHLAIGARPRPVEEPKPARVETDWDDERYWMPLFGGRYRGSSGVIRIW